MRSSAGVWWDGSEVCLYSKRLEEHSFCWPAISAARMRLDNSQLMASLLAGLDLKMSARPGFGDHRRAESACGKMDDATVTVGNRLLCALSSSMVLSSPDLLGDVAEK
ncbi:IS66 family insertion sequence element accessory protein TnpB [Mesorhizobium sp.]|uniref:IS66 family insertion sequence element accessory protein TnpB n=1 Tax=Mesorhizobium sp. TaxID=1871066 RepID=UPI00338E5E2A